MNYINNILFTKNIKLAVLFIFCIIMKNNIKLNKRKIYKAIKNMSKIDLNNKYKISDSLWDCEILDTDIKRGLNLFKLPRPLKNEEELEWFVKSLDIFGEKVGATKLRFYLKDWQEVFNFSQIIWEESFFLPIDYANSLIDSYVSNQIKTKLSCSQILTNVTKWVQENVWELLNIDNITELNAANNES